MKIPKKGKIYSINEGNSPFFNQQTLIYLQSVKGKQSLRYVGSMVADIHRTLLYGGLFAYPSDVKNKKGKLRMLYECFPMAMIMEQAGGVAIGDGNMRILDMTPEHIHDRCGIVLGSAEDVEEYKKY